MKETRMSTAVVTEIQTSLTLEEFREMCGFPQEVFNQLQELGAFDEFLDHGRYLSRGFNVTRKAEGLRRVFELDASSLALLLHFMAEAESLREDLRKMRLTNINPYL